MNDKHKTQQATGRTSLGRLTRLWMALAALAIRLTARALAASWRIERVDGAHHLTQLIESRSAVLPCCWHQRLAGCAHYLLGARARGLRPGFLVSPSRDGELIARVVSGLDGIVLRGSSTRSGARALRELYGVIRRGISPVIQADGPHGPAYRAKTGSLMLARMTRAPLVPMAFSSNHYWQLGSWDALIIPKPFARVVIIIGEPFAVAPEDDIDARLQDLNTTLNALTAQTDAMLDAAPRHPKG